MEPITAFCNNYEVTAIAGTDFIFVFVCCLVEIFIICFTVCNIYLPLSNKSVKKKIPMLFRCLILGYHSFVLIYLVLVTIIKIFIAFNISGVLDYAWDSSCNVVNFWSTLSIAAAYTTCVMFWFFRLIKIFDGTIYSFSKKKEKVIVAIFICVVVTGFISRIIAIIMSYTIVENNSYVFNHNNSDTFCKYKQHVIDFLLILQAPNDISYKYHLNHFYGCMIKSTHITSYFMLFGNILIIIAVPSMNGFLFYQFVKKMSQLLNNTRKVNDRIQRNPINDEQLFIKYLNIIIGVSSISTTLISLPLSVFYIRLFAPLMYFDLILNGYFIIVIFQFGNKLLCQCCKNRIWKLVNNKRDKLPSASSEPSL